MIHPFYGPSERLLRGADARGAGLVSMAAYLGFWAVALVIANRELDARFPRGGGHSGAAEDRSRVILRERFASGEIDQAQYRAMRRVLAEKP